jgi:hypothetical protein
MARGQKAYKFARFARGLNTADGVFGLREGAEDDPQGLGAEGRALQNVVSKHRGNISRRNGCAAVYEDADSLTFKDLSVIGSGSTSFAVASSTAGGLFAIDDAFAKTSLVASGLDTTAPWTFLRMPTISSQGPAFGMNGTDTPRETDGTGAGTGSWTAVTGSLPNGTLLEYWQNTLWVAGKSSDPYKLFWSGIGDPTDWSTDRETKFNPDDGLPLTALRGINSYLLVFKERGIWAVYNEETSANRKFADNVGTLSPGSVVATPTGCFFLDPQQGVFITTGDTVKRISEQIQPTLDQISAANLPSVQATFINGHYYLSATFGSDVEIQQVLDYDVELDSWWVHTPTVTNLAVWDYGTDLVPIGLNGGDLWSMFTEGEGETATDPDGAFESYWSGPFHAFGTPHLRKRCNEIHIDARGTVDIYVATDYDAFVGELGGTGDFTGEDALFGGAGQFGTGAGTFGGGGLVGEGWIYTPGVGRAWSLSFYSAGSDFWEVDAYTMSITTRRD